MESNALYRNHRPQDNQDATALDLDQDYNEGLVEMSSPELKLMQDITLHQMSGATADTRLLLGRVWYRLEQERRRRNADIAKLERMYFGR